MSQFIEEFAVQNRFVHFLEEWIWRGARVQC